MLLSLLPALSLHLHSYPELKPIQSINAHPSNCICIKFDPMGKYFATGSADALVSLWDVDELVCVRCFSRWVELSQNCFSPLWGLWWQCLTVCSPGLLQA